jgi:phosphohistidine phosphatase
MDLVLWRHAEADEPDKGMPDLDRPLTERGHKQAKEMAEWLERQRMPKLTVLCSPARRAQETALKLNRPYKVCKALAIGSTSADLLAAAGWPDNRDTVMLVGHQPALGRLAALLLSGTEADWTIKKGGIWWFSNRVRQDESQTVLRAVINP